MRLWTKPSEKTGLNNFLKKSVTLEIAVKEMIKMV